MEKTNYFRLRQRSGALYRGRERGSGGPDGKTGKLFAKSLPVFVLPLNYQSPEREAFFARDVSLYISVFMEVLIFMALFILIYILIKYLIVDNIHKINRSLSEITNGDLDVKVDVRTNEEFASLSDDINSTVVTLKHYIDEAAARIDKELELAKSIQLSALPSVFRIRTGPSSISGPVCGRQRKWEAISTIFTCWVKTGSPS